MYEFLKLQYEQGLLTAEQVSSYCPTFITQEELTKILGEN